MLIIKISKKLTDVLIGAFVFLSRKRNDAIDKKVTVTEERKAARRDVMNKEIEDARARWADGVNQDTKEIQELYKLR